MGIYPDHGIEYRVKLNNGKFITIISQKELDKRLFESEYYKIREKLWFNNTIFAHEFVYKIQNHDLADIELSKEETSRIYNILSIIDNIKDYGWYEVNRIYYTH